MWLSRGQRNSGRLGRGVARRSGLKERKRRKKMEEECDDTWAHIHVDDTSAKTCK